VAFALRAAPLAPAQCLCFEGTRLFSRRVLSVLGVSPVSVFRTFLHRRDAENAEDPHRVRFQNRITTLAMVEDKTGEVVQLVENEDYYLDHGLMVLTARYLLRRGYCCDQGCRHCPFDELPKDLPNRSTDALSNETTE